MFRNIFLASLRVICGNSHDLVLFLVEMAKFLVRSAFQRAFLPLGGYKTKPAPNSVTTIEALTGTL